MSIFDTDVQKLKNRVLQEVATLAFTDALTPESVLAIPERIIPEGKPLLRCCIYKERAIIGQRVQLALGGDAPDRSVVEVLPIACDECPVEGILVTQACRGCIAHRCLNACPKGAISIVNRHAEIDKAKCVYQCPFGAISDRSYIVEAVRILKESDENRKYRTYAVVAPSAAGQYADVDMAHILGGVRALGFSDIVEAAWGADFVAWLEARELAEKKFLTSSCCPAFVSLVRKKYPQLADNISHNLSPMAHMAMRIRQRDPQGKVIFIGPCIAKKKETLYGPAAQYVDCAITFEEMHALFEARKIDLKQVEPYTPDRASYYGRVFARCGGLAEAVSQALKEQGVSEEEFALKAVSCSGIADCNAALLKAVKGKLEENFIEGMACESGCIGGPACLSHGARNRVQFGKYEKMESERTISGAIHTEDGR